MNEYVANGGNGVQAAKTAGYSPDSAYAIASENLTKPEIAKRIQQRIAEAKNLTPNEIIGTLAAQMRADIADFFDAGGNVDIDRIRQHGLGPLVRKFKVRRTCEGSGEDKMPSEILEFELYDAQEAASKLAKIMSIESHLQRGEVDLELKRERLTLAVQNGLNQGWSLKDTLQYLTIRGISREDLALVRGEDLLFPGTSSDRGS